MPDAAGVVVIGAGPAGSAAAAHLSAAGHDVLVLERMPDAAELTAHDAVLDRALGGHRTLRRAAARLADRPLVTRLASTWALPHEPVMKVALSRISAPTPAQVETCVTPSTMGRVTRAAAHPGTERGVDQR
ncbi:FAD-dependent oxidoreductase [Knoellia sp. LjRoot47]|uniref:FAD-dependent oxidoreductase n=1 Tax=Knoellia sp. LjRoot47 TaxID=3342330 RepID=UPI003ED07DDA